VVLDKPVEVAPKEANVTCCTNAWQESFTSPFVNGGFADLAVAGRLFDRQQGVFAERVELALVDYWFCHSWFSPLFVVMYPWRRAAKILFAAVDTEMPSAFATVF
jgi:hypothetical protein